MLYMICVIDVVDSLEKWLVVWFVYFECLNVLKDVGCLVMVGFFFVVDSLDLGLVGFIGLLVVVEFDLLEVV